MILFVLAYKTTKVLSRPTNKHLPYQKISVGILELPKLPFFPSSKTEKSMPYIKGSPLTDRRCRYYTEP